MRVRKGPRVVPKGSLAIVGGTGRMGRLLVRLFRRGYRVVVASRDPHRAHRAYARATVRIVAQQEAARSDVVVLAVPLARTVEVAESIVPYMHPGSLLVDIASVKTGIADRIAQLLPPGVEYLSLHPLFGPGVRSFAGENVVAIHMRDGRRGRQMVDYLTACRLQVRMGDIGSHDRIMSRLQVLHHFAYLCLCTALLREGETTLLGDFSTYSLRATRKQLMGFARNLDSILEIQRLNPYADEARRAFSEEVARHLGMDDASVEGIRRAMDLLLRAQ